MSLKPYRILAFFIHYRRYGEFAGGSERRFLETSKRFKELGLKVYTLELKPSLKETWIDANYQSLTILRRRPKNILELLSMLLYLCIIGTRLCEKLNCNLIYATRHESPENVIPAYVTSKFCRKPLVILFNAVFMRDELSFHEKLSDRLKRGFKPTSAIVYTLLDFVMSLIYRGAEACIAVSSTMEREIIRNFKVCRTAASGNGINLDKYQKNDIKDKAYDAAFLGRIDPLKGIDTLLQAWRIVADKMPQAKLTLIGGGVKGALRSYQNMIKGLRLEDNVIITGFVWKDEEIIKLLKSSKIFVFPSLREGFGISVAEAMACELPCIISDIPALRENFGEMAVFINPYDAKSFAKAILTLLRDESKRQTLGFKAREYIKKFGWEEVARKEIEVFEKISKTSR